MMIRKMRLFQIKKIKNKIMIIDIIQTVLTKILLQKKIMDPLSFYKRVVLKNKINKKVKM